MKTKVLTVLSATVASMRSDQDWDLTGQPASKPSPTAYRAPSVSTQSNLLVQERQKLEPLTCYELQEQWLLVKRKYNDWQPRCITCPSIDPQKISRFHKAMGSQTDTALGIPGWINGQFPAFEWSLIEWPAGSHFCLIDTDTLTPCLILDQPGQYRVRFVIGPKANHQSDRSEIEAVPAIVSDLTITACESGIESVAIALADFTFKNAQAEEEQEPYSFLVAVYAGLTYL